MRSVRATSAVVAAVMLPGNLRAQTPATSGDSLYAAVDRWVEQGLRRYAIAGAALAIVRDGHIVHRRGFGLADIARGYRVDPDTTVFHVASVTKLLTAIAALQQVESGTLDLERDVRPMLGPMRAAGWDRYPVTLHELLTHTAGLDTRWIGMATERAADVQNLADYLPRAMPPIVDPPGTVVRYSNHGYAAIGRLVEVASGMSWPDYVEQRILQPLGMQRSYARAREPTASHAVPYRYRADTLPEPNIHEHTAPGGAVRSTAGDIARLVASLLDTTSAIPLSPRGKTMILTPQHRISAGVDGFGYGTFEYPNGRVRAASMGGEVPGFSTRLLIVPELGLGVVLMVNRKDPTLAIGVFDSLLARMAAPSNTVAECSPRGGRPTAPIGAVAGQYRANVYDRESFLKIAALLGPVLSVRRDTGESLVVVNPSDNTAARWQRTADSTWMSPTGACLSQVQRGGAPMLAMSTKSGPLMLERIGVASSPAIVLSVLIVAIGVLLLLLVAELWTSLRMRATTQPRHAVQARALTIGVSAVHLTFITLFAVGLSQLAIKYDDRFAFGIPAWFTVALCVPYLALALTALLAYRLARSRGEAGVRRWRGWLAVASSGALLLVLCTWRAVWVIGPMAR